jgi:hypothetical protein
MPVEKPSFAYFGRTSAASRLSLESLMGFAEGV